MSSGKWRRLPLSEVVSSIRNGKSYQNRAGSEGLPIARIQTISDGRVNKEQVGFAGIDERDAGEYLLKAGDILFSHINSFSHVGKVALVSEHDLPLIHGMNLLRLRHDPGVVIPEYLLWVLRTHEFLDQVRLRTRNAVNQASVNIRNLSSCEVPVPPIEEQHRIVAELEEQLGHLEATRAQLATTKIRLEQSRASALNWYFGSGTQRMMTDNRGGALHALSDYLISKSGDSSLIKGKQKTAPAEGLFPAYSASGQDIWTEKAQFSGPGIVVSAVGARCGKAFLARGEWTAVANTHVIQIQPGAPIDIKWLWYLMNNESFWIKSGTAQPFVKVKLTLNREQRIPPLDEQRRIVAELEEQLGHLEATRTRLEETEPQLEELRAALLNRVFSGPEEEL